MAIDLNKLQLDLPDEQTGLSERESSLIKKRKDGTFAPSFLGVTKEFGRELGSNIKEIGKEIPRSIARSFLSTGATIEKGLRTGEFSAETEFRPRGKFQETITGRKDPFSIKQEGAELGEGVGLSPETAGKFATPLGVLSVGLDVLDAPVAKLLKTGFVSTKLTKSLSALDNVDDIKSAVKQDIGIDLQPNTLKRIAKETDVKKINEVIMGEARRLADDVKKTKSQKLINQVADGTPTKGAKSLILDNTKRVVDPVISNKYSLLKKKIVDQSAGARKAKAATKAEVLDIQRTLVGEIKENLPPVVRGKHLSKVAGANTPKKLAKALDELEADFVKHKELVKESAEIGRRKSKIAFMRKVGEFNQTTFSDIKKTVGVDKPLTKMNAAELDKVIDETKNRLRFRNKRVVTATDDVPQEIYESIDTTTKTAVRRKTDAVKQDFTDGFKKTFSVVSERLRGADPALLNQMRKLTGSTEIKTAKRLKKVEKLFKKSRKMDKIDATKFDLALKNGDKAMAQKLAKQYGLEKELGEARVILDGLHKDLKDLGVDIGYLENYFPRLVQDKKLLMKILDPEQGDLVSKAIKERELKLGRPLKEHEQLNIINSMFRGYSVENISLSSLSNKKKRLIPFIDDEINQAYLGWDESLAKYILNATEEIEMRKTFGKIEPEILKDNADIVSGVSKALDNLVQKKKITAVQSEDLRSVLNSYFNEKPANSFIRGFKQIAYATGLSDIKSTVTQLGDLAISFKANGLIDSLKAIPSKKTFKPEDIGVSRVMQELKTGVGLTNLTDKLLRANGFTQMDFFGKKVFMESALNRAKGLATKNPELLRKELLEQFPANEIDDVARKLVDGVVDDDTAFYMFNRLSDFQPISKLEVPQLYLDSEWGKMFFTFKTWTIKTLNSVHRDVAQKAKTEGVPAAMEELLKWASVLTVAGVTTDTIKDFISGKEVDLSDSVVNTLLSYSLLFNKYTLDKATNSNQPAREILQNAIVPPTGFFDRLGKDAINTLQGDVEGFDDLKSTRQVPVIGSIIHDRFGGGKNWIDRQRTETGGIGIDLGDTEIDVPTIELDSLELDL